MSAHLVGLDAGELEALQGAMGTGDQTEVLGRLVSRVATLEAAAGEAEAQRRALHNQLVELRGNVMLLSSCMPWPPCCSSLCLLATCDTLIAVLCVFAALCCSSALLVLLTPMSTCMSLSW